MARVFRRLRCFPNRSWFSHPSCSRNLVYSGPRQRPARSRPIYLHNRLFFGLPLVGEGPISAGSPMVERSASWSLPMKVEEVSLVPSQVWLSVVRNRIGERKGVRC